VLGASLALGYSYMQRLEQRLERIENWVMAVTQAGR
jgi:hypothetical protein